MVRWEFLAVWSAEVSAVNSLENCYNLKNGEVRFGESLQYGNILYISEDK